MNLRLQLLAQAKVAGCVRYETQPATFPENSATSNATAAQQNPANPHEIRVLSATSTATPPQFDELRRGQKTPPRSCAELRQLRGSCAPGQDPFDDRSTCTACRNLWPGNHCLTHRAAGLTTRDLAADFTALMQRCDAYLPQKRPEARA
jgi:hypothetical protein